MSQIEEMISLAKEQVGNGAGKYRTWFYGYNATGVAWCAVFVSWLFENAGIKMVKTDGAGCFAREGNPEYGTWYESEYSDSGTTPKVGDIVTFVWNYAGRYYSQDRYYSDHVGIVYAVDNNNIYTIEGNSGASNDTSTVKYQMYSRKSGAINGYFRPKYDTAEKEENQEVRKMNNLQKGDTGDSVLAYKTLLYQAYLYHIINTKVDNTNGFGEGTHKATLEFQKLYKLEEDGIAGVKTMTALRDAVTNKVVVSMKGHNALIDDLTDKLNEMKV